MGDIRIATKDFDPIITLWLVGTDREDAKGRLPFSSEEEALSYQKDPSSSDEGIHLRLFTVQATLNYSTLKEVG